MSGRNLNGDFSICSAEVQADSDGLNYRTLKWGYDEEAQAVAALKAVAEETGIPLADLVVVKTLFAADL